MNLVKKIIIIIFAVLALYFLLNMLHTTVKKINKVSIIPTPTVQQATSTLTPTLSRSSNAIGNRIQVSGLVILKYSDYKFSLRSGSKNFIVNIDMTGGTQVINSRGSQVPLQFIQVGGNLTVTGLNDGSTINAKVILVPTIKDK